MPHISKKEQLDAARRAADEQARGFHQNRLQQAARLESKKHSEAFEENLDLLKQGLRWLYNTHPKASTLFSKSDFASYVNAALQIAVKAVQQDQRAFRESPDVDSQAFRQVFETIPPTVEQYTMSSILQQAIGGTQDYKRSLNNIARNEQLHGRAVDTKEKIETVYFLTLDQVYRMIQYTLTGGHFDRKESKVKAMLQWAKESIGQCIGQREM